MGKRQLRIFAGEIVGSKLKILDKEVNLVYKNGKTLSATVKNIFANEMLLQDHFLQKHNVRLEEIEEIVLDFVAPY